MALKEIDLLPFVRVGEQLGRQVVERPVELLPDCEIPRLNRGGVRVRKRFDFGRRQRQAAEDEREFAADLLAPIARRFVSLTSNVLTGIEIERRPQVAL